MRILYNLVLYLSDFILSGISIVGKNQKIKSLKVGRKNTFARLKQLPVKETKRVWAHAASLGEFEMLRPLLESLEKKESFDRVYRVLTTVQSSALVDDVTVQNDLGQYTKAPVLAGVADEVTDVHFYNHNQNGDEAQGIEFNQLTEDDTLVTATLLMNKADNYDSINVKIRVLDSNSDAFDLFSRVVPMNNYPLNADNVRLVNLVENLDYLLPSTDRNTFELVIGTIDSTTYEINLKHTFLNSWRYWLAQANALPEFLDPSLPNNGVNHEWVRYVQGG